MCINEIKETMSEIETYLIGCKLSDSNKVMYYFCLHGYYNALGGKESIINRIQRKGLLDLIENEKDKLSFKNMAYAYSNKASYYFRTGFCDCSNKLFITNCIHVTNFVNGHKTYNTRIDTYASNF